MCENINIPINNFYDSKLLQNLPLHCITILVSVPFKTRPVSTAIVIREGSLDLRESRGNRESRDNREPRGCGV